MRKFISGLLAIAAAAFTGCYESGTDADNTSREARISISPAAIGFDADGRTTDGLAFGTYIVTVNPYGKMYSDWHAELVGTDWATLDYHTASPDGAVEKALRITCSANTDYKRTGTLRVTLSKTGESVDFPITQVGLKPDATLTLSTESDIEMMALEPAEVTVTFETNMPASTVTAELEEGVEWLTCTLDREAGTVVLAASDNTSPTDMREATVTVSAGTEDTSLATRQIKVRQLANETYLFIYGSGIPHFAAFGDAAQMNKNDLVFGLDHYFRSGKVILSTSRTPDAYPRYALTADGKLAVLADAAAEAAAPELTFGIAGMNALRVTIALDDDNNVVVHKMDCETATRLKSSFGNRLVATQWEESPQVTSFMATIHIEGIDRMGILQELIHEISINMSINIRNLNIEANQGVFTCNLVVRVSDAAIVVRMCRQIKKINGVKSAVRTS